MSFIVAAIVVGASALFGGGTWAWRRRKREPQKPSATEPAPPVKLALLAKHGFSVELGDVVEIAGRELWLEEGWLLSEGDDAVAAIFAAKEATLVALPSPSRALYLLDEVKLVVPGDPPLTLESNGIRFERVRRLPVRVEPLEKTAPLPWDEAILSEYRGLASDALFVLGKSGGVRAWQGRVAGESEIERWGGGKSTLE